MTADSDVACLIVTYNPNLDRFNKVIQSVLGQVRTITVIDNGSRNLDLIRIEIPNLDGLVVNRRNLGLAKALNLGIEKIRRDYHPSWILTLDQDSVVTPGAIAMALNELSSLACRDAVWVVSLGMNDGTSTHKLISARMVITSGNIVRSEAFNFVKYRDEFFIDQIDWDFSHQILECGKVILIYDGFFLDHEVGKKITGPGKRGWYEPGYRLYYIMRNSTILVLERKLTVQYYTFQIRDIAGRLAEQQGVKALFRPLILGTFDAVRRKGGIYRYDPSRV